MDTPDFFVGARLGSARAKAGISLEKAAKDTRIRVQRLREIEADDFSAFAHPTYARLFLLDYADYLGVPQDEIRSLLPDRAGSAGGGFQYIEALSRDPSSPVVPMRNRRPKLLWWFIVLGLFVLVAAAVLFTYFTVKKIERVARSTPLSAVTDKTGEEAPATAAPPGTTGVLPPAPATDVPTPEPQGDPASGGSPSSDSLLPTPPPANPAGSPASVPQTP